MDAVITAGGIPSEKDPLYPYTQGKPKAMVDIAGKPMIQWILDALGNSKDVEHVVLIGLDIVEVSTFTSVKAIVTVELE